MELIEAGIGVDASYTITLADPSGNPVTTYTTGDTPSAVVWPGKSYATTFTPTVAWISAPAGTIQVTIPGNLTASLTPQRYRMRVQIATSNGLNVDAWDGFLTLTQSPGGTDTLPSTYCTYADLIRYEPDLDDYFGDEDTAGYVDQCHQARQWIENCIQRHYRYSGFQGLESFGYPVGLGLQYTSDANSPVLRGYLDANKLVVDQPLIELTAKYALYLILQSLVGVTNESSPYQEKAFRYKFESENLAKAYVAQFDINADGITDLTVNLGVASARY